MNLRVGFSWILCGVVALGLAQDDSARFKKKSHAPQTASNGPVTVAEASATFAHVAGLYKSVLHVTAPKMKGSSSSIQPVTRAQVIDTMMSFYKAAEPAFTNTPKSVNVDVARLKVDEPSVKPKLVKLISLGCVGGFGPLATGSKKTLSVAEFGDSVGFFVSRIVEMTHHSSPKWSPYLRDNRS